MSGAVAPDGRADHSAAFVTCQECDLEMPGDSMRLRLELTCDDEPLTYCAACWEREFGES